MMVSVVVKLYLCHTLYSWSTLERVLLRWDHDQTGYKVDGRQVSRLDGGLQLRLETPR